MLLLYNLFVPHLHGDIKQGMRIIIMMMDDN